MKTSILAITFLSISLLAGCNSDAPRIEPTVTNKSPFAQGIQQNPNIPDVAKKSLLNQTGHPNPNSK